MINKQKTELASFQNIWHGGYFSDNNNKRNQIGLERFLVENIGHNLDILEIGCGRGRWSKFIYENLYPNTMRCIDALDELHNGFWQYVGNDKEKIFNILKF